MFVATKLRHLSPFLCCFSRLSLVNYKVTILLIIIKIKLAAFVAPAMPPVSYICATALYTNMALKIILALAPISCLLSFLASLIPVVLADLAFAD